MRITKSRFMVYNDSPIHFWAAVHGHISVSEADPMMEYLAAQGYRAEPLAVQYLRDHVLPTYADAELIEQLECANEPFFARIDAVIYDRQAGVYDLYEIKSGTSPDNYVPDVAFQRTVFRSKLPVRRTFLVHLNGEYVRRGDLDLSQLFTHIQLDDAIDAVAESIVQIQHQAHALLTLADPSTLPPCTSPKDCPCPQICHPNLPEYSIYNIPRLKKDVKAELRQHGIVSIHALPADTKIPASATLHVAAMQRGQNHIDWAAISSHLDGYTYPLTFLDYEAAKQAIPLNGYRPNQDAAFQYALAIIDHPGAEPRTAAYLSDGTGDFVRTLIEHLLNDMPAQGSVVVWNQSYEKGINKNMADAYPTYADALRHINERIVDLADVFKDNYYVDPRFKGSWSIKAVLPALVPQLTYTDLAIANGGSAVLEWNRMVDPQTTATDQARIRTDLLTYCGQDAWAMLEIWRFLQQNRPS